MCPVFSTLKMEQGEMIANFNTAPAAGGYNWILVGVVFLVWGLISGLLPRFFQLLVLWIKPKIIYRMQRDRYKVMWIGEVKEKNYWKERYMDAVANAEEPEYYDEETDFDHTPLPKTRLDQWREEKKKETLRPRYTRDQWAEMLGGGEEEDNSIEL